MRNAAVLLVFGWTIFASCKNDSAPVVTKYTDINPDSCMCSTPAPGPVQFTDSTVHREFDLDGNGINDLKVEFKQYRYFLSPMTQPICYLGTLIRLNSRLEIDNDGYYARAYGAGDKVFGEEAVWTNSDVWFVDSGTPTNNTDRDYNGEKYFVYRIENDHGTHDYGWIRIYHDYHTVCIRDFTFSSDSPITTGVH
jgi:hypothetical protein